MNANPPIFNLTHFCLANHAENSPYKAALIIAHENGAEEVWSYQKLFDAVLQLASGLKSLPIKPGSRITMHTNKSAQLLIFYFASIAASFVPIPLQAHLTASEIEFILRDSQSNLFYQSNELKTTINIPSYCMQLDEENLLKLQHSKITPYLFNTTFNDPAYMMYTASKHPKGVIHAHRVMLGREPIRRSYLDIRPDDVILHIGKPHWTYHMGIGAMEPLSLGATTIIYTKDASPKDIYNLIERYKVSILSTHNSLYQKILQDIPPSQLAIQSLRHAILSGESASKDIHKFWAVDYKIPFYESFTTAEFSNFISSGPLIELRNGSIGKIQPSRRVTILKLNGGTKSCSPNEIGLIAAHCGNLGFMAGYFNQPEAENYAFRESWFLTGDTAHMDDDGYIWLHKKIAL